MRWWEQAVINLEGSREAAAGKAARKRVGDKSDGGDENEDSQDGAREKSTSSKLN